MHFGLHIQNVLNKQSSSTIHQKANIKGVSRDTKTDSSARQNDVLAELDVLLVAS